MNNTNPTETTVARSTRSKDPNTLIRDKALERYNSGIESSSPRDKVWPDGMVALFAMVASTSRPRINRWLHDPTRHPLNWDELQEIANELGGKLKCMFSIEAH